MHRFIPDADGEALALSRAKDVIVPFSFVHEYNRGTVVSAYPQLTAIVKRFLRLHGNDPTAEAALSFLFEKISPCMQKLGYKDDWHRDNWGYILRQTQESLSAPIMAVPLTEEDQAHNLTTCNIKEILSAGCLAFGIKENDTVVSVALTHTAPNNADHVEVGVETAVRARRKGYATAALCALASVLRERGVQAEYRCSRDNIGSYRVACGAGFAEVGKFYRYLGRRVNLHGV